MSRSVEDVGLYSVPVGRAKQRIFVVHTEGKNPRLWSAQVPFQHIFRNLPHLPRQMKRDGFVPVVYYRSSIGPGADSEFSVTRYVEIARKEFQRLERRDAPLIFIVSSGSVLGGIGSRIEFSLEVPDFCGSFLLGEGGVLFVTKHGTSIGSEDYAVFDHYMQREFFSYHVAASREASP